MTLTAEDKKWITNTLDDKLTGIARGLPSKHSSIIKDKTLETIVNTGKFLKSVPKKIETTIVNQLAKTRKTFDGLVSSVRNVNNTVVKQVTLLGHNIIRNISTFKTGIIKTVEGIKTKVLNFVSIFSPKRILSNITNSIKNLIFNNPLIKGIRNIFNFGKNMVKGAISGIGNLFGLRKNYVQADNFENVNSLGGSSKNYVVARDATFSGTTNVFVGALDSNDYKERIEKEQIKKHNSLVSNTLIGIKELSKDINEKLKGIHTFNLLKLAGIAAAVVAAVTLLNWFKDQGLGGVVKSVLDGVDNIIKSLHFNQKDVEKQNKITNEIPYQVITDVSNPSSEIDYLNKQIDSNNNFSTEDIINFDAKSSDKWWNKKSVGDITSELSRQGAIPSNVSKFFENRGRNESTSNLNVGNVKSFSNDKGGVKFSLPIQVEVTHVEPVEDYGLGIILENRHYDRLAVVGVKKLYVPKGLTVPKDTLIALLSEKGYILGDLDKFLNDDKLGVHEKNLEDRLNSSEINEKVDKNYKTIAGSKRFNELANAQYNELAKKQNQLLESEKVKDNPYTYLSDAINYAKESYKDASGYNELSSNIKEGLQSSNVTTALQQTKQATPNQVKQPSTNETQIITPPSPPQTSSNSNSVTNFGPDSDNQMYSNQRGIRTN